MEILNYIFYFLVTVLIVYIILFVAKHKIPASLSVTAEYSKDYTEPWRIMICVIMGYLSYYLPNLFPVTECGYLPILLNAGVSGLALSGYFSYYVGDEDKRTINIHKIGSFSGALCVFIYAILSGYWLFTCIIAVISTILGLLFKGHQKDNKNDTNSLVFWYEISIIILIVTLVTIKIIDK